MNYATLWSDKARDQLNEIIRYIAADSGSEEIALKYSSAIDRAIANLSDHPNIGGQPRYSNLRRQGYRVLIVERNLIFYWINESEKVVMIRAIVDGRREYRNLIRTTG